MGSGRQSLNFHTKSLNFQKLSDKFRNFESLGPAAVFFRIMDGNGSVFGLSGRTTFSPEIFSPSARIYFR